MMDRREVLLICNPEGGRTKQSFADDANINVLVKRWLGGVPIPEPKNPGMYGDFSEIGTYFEAQNMVGEAMEHFMLLPAEIRQEFDNDPGKMIEFLEDPENAERAEELGLVAPSLNESAEETTEETGGETPPVVSEPTE